jgi:hypothetical protein
MECRRKPSDWSMLIKLTNQRASFGNNSQVRWDTLVEPNLRGFSSYFPLIRVRGVFFRNQPRTFIAHRQCTS